MPVHFRHSSLVIRPDADEPLPRPVERELKNRFLGGVLSPVVAGAAAVDAGRLCAGVRAVHALAGAGKVRRQFCCLPAVGLWPLAGVCRERYPHGATALDFAVCADYQDALPLGAWVPLSVVLVTFALNWLALTVIVLLFAARLFGAPQRYFVRCPLGSRLVSTAIGLAWVVSTAQILVRDIEGMLGPLFMLLSFVCGIQYGLDSIPAAWRDAVLANPFTHAIARLHDHLPRGRGLCTGGRVVCWRALRSSRCWVTPSSAAWRRMWMTTYE